MATNTVETEDNERRYRAPALEKGLDILELLAREGEPLTTSQMANKLGRSVSELFRMVLTLEDRGYIAQAGEREGYGLTNKMFSLGLAQTPTRTLIELALPQMKVLTESIGQSCHMTVASNDHIVVVARVESPRDLGFSVRIGYRRPIAESNSGGVLIGLLPESERLAAIERLSATQGEHIRSFMPRVEQAMRDKYVVNPSYFVEGIVDLSSPVFDSNGVVAALTVPYVRCFPEKTNVEEALNRLCAASRRISELLQAEAQ